ncbi:hypothetical protein BGZ83_002410 [Gryganskiella cystojenkinii]|nr:hypothetical protein BGZ83_002410 [Gryganskiella cystojenkinii]
MPTSRSDSFTDEDEIPSNQHHLESHHNVLMSPPLSQKSQDCGLQEPSSFPLSDTEYPSERPQQPRPTLTLQLQQQQQQQQPHDHHHHQSPSVHPFDQHQTSPSTPKKTLNWVNALPSHFDATSPESHPRKRRRRTNREELDILEDAFAKNLLPDATTRQELGERLGMSVRAVQIWFQNRRQTLRKKSICSNGGGSGSNSGGHHNGSEEDYCSRSEGDHHDLIHRRSSGDSIMSVSPLLSPTNEVTPRSFSKKGSRSCSDLMSLSPPPVRALESQLLRAETCSSLPTIVSPLPSPKEHGDRHRLRSVSPCKPLSEPEQVTRAVVEAAPETDSLVVVVKHEVVELSPSQVLSCPPSPTNSNDTIEIQIKKDDTDDKKEEMRGSVNANTADKHLSMLLQEARRYSVQGSSHPPPPMALWSKTSNKPILNPTFSGTSQSMTACLPLPNRSLSTPSMMRHATSGTPSLHNGSKHGQHHHRTIQKDSRKHRPEPNSTYQPASPFSRTMSLMEQVINRQQQQQQHHQQHNRHYQHNPSNFRQSSLSKRQGMYNSNINSNNNPSSYRSSSSIPISLSTNLSQWGRRLQQQISDRSSESRIEKPQLPTFRRSGFFGQTAVRARRLSIGKYLFDSETDEDATDDALSPPTKQQYRQQSQKRRVRPSPAPAMDREDSVDGDETDEDDFVAALSAAAAHAKKRLALATSSRLEDRQWNGQQQQFKRIATPTRKSLKASLSTLSLVGLSASPPPSGSDFGQSYPALERNRTWNGSLPPTSTIFSSPRKTPAEPSYNSDHSRSNHGSRVNSNHGSRVGSPSLSTSPSGASSAPHIPQSLNLDELECASVLAGLGWSR